MSVQHKNSQAYDLSLFEESERTRASGSKDSNLIRLTPAQEEKLKRAKHNPLLIGVVSLLTIVLTTVLIMIVYNNVVINELNSSIVAANSTIEAQQEREAQYQLVIDSTLSEEFIKSYAENKLGMVKMNDAQKEFISLYNDDCGEVIREDNSNDIMYYLYRAFNGIPS